MSVSGNISGSGPVWDPSGVSGSEGELSKVGNTGPEDSKSVSGNIFSDGASKMVSKQEATIRSSAGAEFLSQTEIGTHKRSRELDSTTSSGKLKLRNSRVKSSQRAFQGSVKKSGRKRSFSSPAVLGASPQRQEIILPTDAAGSKRVKTFPLEVSSLFIGSVGFAKESFDTVVPETELSSISSFAKAMDLAGLNLIESKRQSVSKNSPIEMVSDFWSEYSMMGKEFGSLDLNYPEMEAMTARSAVNANKLTGPQDLVRGMAITDFSDDLTTEMLLRADEANNQQGTEVQPSKEYSNFNSKQVKDEEQNKTEEETLKLLLLKSIPPGGFPLLGGQTLSSSMISGSTTVRIPDKKLGQIDTIYSTDAKAMRLVGESSLHFESTTTRSLQHLTNIPGGIESIRRDQIRVNAPVESSVSSFIDPQSGRSQEISLSGGENSNSNLDNTTTFIAGSGFSFPSELGLAVAPEKFRDPLKEQDLTGLRSKLQREGPPSPIVYQYRNVSIDPPLILRNPPTYGSSNRIQLTGKPSINEARRDGNQGRQDDGQNKKQDTGKFQKKDDESKKKMSLE